jgi:putative tryptophan/tyrosine transport system substrate-binding protein
MSLADTPNAIFEPAISIWQLCSHYVGASRRKNPTRRVELNRLPKMEFVRRHRPHRFANALLAQKICKYRANQLSSYATIGRHGGKPMRVLRVTRREFVVALGGAAAWPLVARGQQPAKLAIVGYLGAWSASDAQWAGAFLQRLNELGWIEGRNFVIEYRWAEGNRDRAAELTAEFVKLKVDVIVTYVTPMVLGAKQATTTIPIIFAGIADPVGTGVVASLARPGGNLTGLSLQQTDIASKRLEFLREIVPSLRRLAIMVNSTNPASVLDMNGAKQAARVLGLDVIILEVERAEDIARAFEQTNGRAEGLYICIDALFASNGVRISTLALAARLPTTGSFRQQVAAGVLMSYTTNFPDLFRRIANYADKILRGAKPGDIPVEQPTKFDLIINLTTAKALGLTVPPTLLALADEVIE